MGTHISKHVVLLLDRDDRDYDVTKVFGIGGEVHYPNNYEDIALVRVEGLEHIGKTKDYSNSDLAPPRYFMEQLDEKTFGLLYK